jgi:hypothetical protein
MRLSHLVFFSLLLVGCDDPRASGFSEDLKSVAGYLDVGCQYLRWRAPDGQYAVGGGGRPVQGPA